MNKKNIKNQDDLSKILRAVGDPQRLRLICSLFGKKKECVTQLSKDISDYQKQMINMKKIVND